MNAGIELVSVGNTSTFHSSRQTELQHHILYITADMQLCSLTQKPGKVNDPTKVCSNFCCILIYPSYEVIQPEKM